MSLIEHDSRAYLRAAEQLHVFMASADRMQIAALAQPINVLHSLFLTRESQPRREP
jgi:alpha-L-arabinofuranosidase